MRTFRAPWGKMLIGMSVLGTLVVGIAAVSVWSHPPREVGLSAVLLVFVALLLPVTALFTVRGYAVTPDAILVRRLFWSTRLPREGLISVTAQPGAMRGALRVFGNGGLYSFTGWYWSKALGRFQPYVTDLNRTVVLRWEKKTVVVSPDDPEGFVKEVMG